LHLFDTAIIFDGMKKVYENLKAIRQAKGITQESLAERIGVTTGNYIRLEKGDTKLTIERLYQFAEIFDVSVSDIVNYSGSLNPKNDIEYYRGLIDSHERKIKKQQDEIDELRDEVANNESSTDNQIKDLKQKLKDQKRTIEERERELAHKDEMIKTLNELIEGLKLALASTKEAVEAIKQSKA
jgi:transcriptional regulator with XRE-family HTH domain